MTETEAMGCRMMVRDRGDGSKMTERGRNRDERRQRVEASVKDCSLTARGQVHKCPSFTDHNSNGGASILEQNS